MVDVPSVKVVGRFGMTAADGVDADDEPDVIWCDSGTVRLKPLNSYTKVAGGSPSPWTAGHSIIEVPLDSEGYLTWSGARYIRVLDLTSPAVNPVIPANKATHSVEFKNIKAGGTIVSFDSVNVRLAADTVDPLTGVCDLTKLMPVPTAGGTPITRGEAGRGIAALDVDGNALVATFTDGSTVETDLPAALVETDAQVAAAISNPSSLAGGALNAAIGQSVTGLNFRTDPAGDSLVSGLDNQSGVVKVVNFTDSTGTNPYRWPRLSATAIAARWPDTYLGFHEWKHDTTEDGYNTREVVSTGSGFIPGAAGGVTTVLADNFNRTAADVIGTTGQTGGAWLANATNAAGNWSLNGTKMVRATSAVVGSVMQDLGQSGDTAFTLTGVTMSTLPDTANRELNVYVRSDLAGLNCLRMRLQVATSTGAVAYALLKGVAGTSTSLATGTANPIPANTASNTFNVSVSTMGAVVTCVVNGVTISHTLSGGDQAATPGTHVGVSSSGGTLVGTTIDSVGATVNMPASTDSGHGLLFFNACKPGATLAYHTTHLNAMTPTDTDVAVINMGHNYGTDSPATFLAALETFIDLVLARAHGARVIVTSQNPQYAPRTAQQITAHAARNTALRVWAHEQGHGYIPGHEAFIVRADRGQSLVLPDGLHPDSSVQKPDNGNRAWAAAFAAYLEAHSMIPRYIDA